MLGPPRQEGGIFTADGRGIPRNMPCVEFPPLLNGLARTRPGARPGLRGRKLGPGAGLACHLLQSGSSSGVEGSLLFALLESFVEDEFDRQTQSLKVRKAGFFRPLMNPLAQQAVHVLVLHEKLRKLGLQKSNPFWHPRIPVRLLLPSGGQLCTLMRLLDQEFKDPAQVHVGPNTHVVRSKSDGAAQLSQLGFGQDPFEFFDFRQMNVCERWLLPHLRDGPHLCDLSTFAKAQVLIREENKMLSVVGVP